MTPHKTHPYECLPECQPGRPEGQEPRLPLATCPWEAAGSGAPCICAQGRRTWAGPARRTGVFWGNGHRVHLLSVVLGVVLERLGPARPGGRIDFVIRQE